MTNKQFAFAIALLVVVTLFATVADSQDIVLEVESKSETHTISLASVRSCLIDCDGALTFQVCALTKDVPVSFTYNKAENTYVNETEIKKKPYILEEDVAIAEKSIISEYYDIETKEKISEEKPSETDLVEKGTCKNITISLKKHPLESIDVIPHVDGIAHIEYEWLNASWGKRNALTLSNNITVDGTITTLLITNTSSYSFNSNLSDARITWENETYYEERPFEFIQYNTSMAEFYINTTNKTGGTFYIYSNNTAAQDDVTSPNEVFYLYDDFDDSSINYTKWNITNNTLEDISVTEGADGALTFSGTEDDVSREDVFVTNNLTNYPILSGKMIMIYQPTTISTGCSNDASNNGFNQEMIGIGNPDLGTWIATSTGIYHYELHGCGHTTPTRTIYMDESDGSSYSVGLHHKKILVNDTTNGSYFHNFTSVIKTHTGITYNSGKIVMGMGDKKDGVDGDTYGGTLKINYTGYGQWSGETFSLGDQEILPLAISIDVPSEGECIEGNTFDVNYTTYNDTNLNTVWYRVDSGSNTTVSGGTFQVTTTLASHTIYLFANDSSNTITNDSISITTNTSCTADLGSGGGSGGGGGGGSTQLTIVTTGNKTNCDIQINPSNISITEKNTLAEIQITNKHTASYTPEFEFNGDISTNLRITNQIGQLLSGDISTFGIKFNSGLFGGKIKNNATLTLSSQNCNDILIPIDVDYNSRSFLDFYDPNASLLQNSAALMDAEFFGGLPFLKVGFILLFSLLVGIIIFSNEFNKAINKGETTRFAILALIQPIFAIISSIVLMLVIILVGGIFI